MRPFPRHVVRGLATVLPPVLTFVILLWAWRTIDQYVLHPLHVASCEIAAHVAVESRRLDGEHLAPVADLHAIASKTQPAERLAPPATAEFDGRPFRQLADGEYIPANVFDAVDAAYPGETMPTDAIAVYRRYAAIEWLRPAWFVPAALLVLTSLVYLAGKIGNRSFGRMVRGRVDAAADRLPLVRNVYAAVKQVTQHVFAAPGAGVSRVVAVEYPRKGIWCVAYVIQEGLAQVADRAEEPMVTLFFDTSPVPMSGYTIMVPKSQTIPLDIHFDDALRWVMSCGIIVPPQQAKPVAKTSAT